MDSGLVIGWVLEMAVVCFALSAVLHGVLGRIALWSVLAALASVGLRRVMSKFIATLHY